MAAPDDFIGPVNIGNPGEFTIRELAELVIELTGAKSKLVKRPLPADDPTRRRPDITLAKAKLGWEPKVPLREGLAETIKWFRSINIADYRAPTPNYYASSPRPVTANSNGRNSWYAAMPMVTPRTSAAQSLMSQVRPTGICVHSSKAP
jgi:hypothetical protein